jgi:uncharacterized membrane protein
MSATVSVEHLAVAGRRIESVDILRGVVMILMAVDHVRVFSGLPAGGPGLGIFVTRWITHFCAPAFVFFAGTSAYLYGETRTRADLSRFLVTRGVWLVLLELTIIRFSWTFNLDYAHYILAGVIWMIGCCMILLAGIARLPLAAIAAFGLIVIAGHNAIDPRVPALIDSLGTSRLALLWQILYFGPMLQREGSSIAVLYSIVPWVGVMAAGYAFGAVLRMEVPARRRWCLRIGVGAIPLFLVLRGFNLYGDPRPWSESVRSFLNTTKYPASLSFLLMTLGPTIALVPALVRARSPVTQALAIFGRVPFFFYLIHIPLIHVLAIVVSKMRLGEVSPWLFANHPMGNPPAPEGYAWSLPLLYLVWAIAVALLYLASRWFAEVKATRRSSWLSYL